MNEDVRMITLAWDKDIDRLFIFYSRNVKAHVLLIFTNILCFHNIKT